MTWRFLLEQMIETLRDPKAGAKWAIGLNWPLSARWDALILVTVLAVILVQLTSLFEPVTLVVTVGAMQLSPIVAMGISQLTLLVASALLVDRLGRMFGGTGDLSGALAIVTWLQVILLAINLVQIVLSFTFPLLAGLLSIVTFFLIFWLMAHFIMALHGFQSFPAVLIGMLLGMLALALSLSILLALLNVGISVGGADGL